MMDSGGGEDGGSGGSTCKADKSAQPCLRRLDDPGGLSPIFEFMVRTVSTYLSMGHIPASPIDRRHTHHN